MFLFNTLTLFMYVKPGIFSSKYLSSSVDSFFIFYFSFFLHYIKTWHYPAFSACSAVKLHRRYVNVSLPRELLYNLDSLC